MSEIFQIIFNTQGQNVLSLVDTAVRRTQVTFNVNFGAFLPKKYKKFHCQFVFKSQNYVGAGNNGLLTDNGFVNMNLGRVNVYDGLQMTNNLGVIYPVYLNTTANAQASFYTTTNNDNCDFFIDYPINQQITVTLNNLAGVPMANMPHWYLALNLMAVSDSDLKAMNTLT